MFLRGELRKYAKKSSFENFESPPYSTSVSMPLISLSGLLLAMVHEREAMFDVCVHAQDLR